MKSRTNPGRRAAACVATAASVLLVAACGGGGSGDAVSTFRASRVLAFGDESSVINTNGTKYSINGYTANTTTIDCTVNPLWVQTVATAYGLVYPDCNPTGVTAPVSRILATVGARAADLVTQVDKQANNGGFAAGDLSIVFIGVNDIIGQFNQYPAVGEPQLTANVTAAGLLEASQINRLADAGSKVVVTTIYDLGLSPLAGGRTTDNAGLLSRLTTAYNTALRANITNDGRRIGLALFDEYTQSVATAADAGNSGVTFVNARDAACAVALPNCNSSTLVSGIASGATWFWADNTHLSSGAQASLGAVVTSRATNNPFSN